MYGQWRPYVPVAQRRRKGATYAAKLVKKLGRAPQPVIADRKIAKTFWGKAWCDHIEGLSDFSNRLPRGRTYARNGSIVDLHIAPGVITAIVSGSDIYNIRIEIDPIKSADWKRLVRRCGQNVDSLLDLLSGRISDGTMQVLTHPSDGLMPRLKEFSTNCDCPDWADLCKHLAAVLYGVGARLDKSPDLLFLLRGVDPADLILSSASESVNAIETESALEGDLSDIFGVEIDSPESPPPTVGRKKAATKKARNRKKAAKKGDGISLTLDTAALDALTHSRSAKRKPKASVKSIPRPGSLREDEVIAMFLEAARLEEAKEGAANKTATLKRTRKRTGTRPVAKRPKRRKAK